MFPFRQILFPVDYSDACAMVAPYVKDMAQHFSAELTLLHAYTANVLIPSEDAATDAEWLALMGSRQERRLREFAAEMLADVPARLVIENEDAAAAIHAYAVHEGTDLVMLPTEGHGPLRKFLLGSVTAKVLHDTGAAVWTGSRSHLVEQPLRLPYRSIVCAVDESDETEAVMRLAQAFAGRYGAALAFLHAVPAPSLAWEIDYAGYQHDMMDAADLRLREMKDRLGIDAPHHIAGEPLVQAVGEEAERRGADLIVVGRGHAQGWLGGTWSRLYSLIRQAPCPVLSV